MHGQEISLAPLTREMLEWLHQAKECKRKADTHIQQAKADGKAREANRKRRVMQITGKATAQSLQPYIQVDSGSLGIPTMALIDTRADTNTISYALWVKLGKPHLTPH